MLQIHSDVKQRIPLCALEPCKDLNFSIFSYLKSLKVVFLQKN